MCLTGVKPSGHTAKGRGAGAEEEGPAPLPPNPLPLPLPPALGSTRGGFYPC
jgi:hypothetical protein